MICPKCGGKVIVAHSISTDTSVIRKRKCIDCDNMFYTTEQQEQKAKYAFTELVRLKSAKAYDCKRVRK
jgi:transcriptional regulator NrdR family protein